MLHYIPAGERKDEECQTTIPNQEEEASHQTQRADGESRTRGVLEIYWSFGMKIVFLSPVEKECTVQLSYAPVHEIIR